MKKALFIAAVLASSARLGVITPSNEPISQTVSMQVKRRKQNKTQKAIERFYGYASDRKGKGQKKREASAMHRKGWK